MELAQVYKMIYEGPTDRLRGVIVSADEESFFQYIFKDTDMGDDAHATMMKCLLTTQYKKADNQLYTSKKALIKSRDHIMLNGPTGASIDIKGGEFALIFCLFGVIHRNITLNLERDVYSTPLEQKVMAEDGSRYVLLFYALFENAAEARVKVTLTSIVKSAFDLWGVVTARTSAIKHHEYSSLVFFKDYGGKMTVAPEQEIILPLSRPLVALPLGSQLILDFGLCADDNDKLVQERMYFDAVKDGKTPIYDTTECSKFKVKVEVSWRYEDKPREP